MKNLNVHAEIADVRERSLQIAHELCDVLKVREKGGNNRGAEVEEMQASAGLAKGDPWCAAQITFCLKTAGAKGLPSHLGSVAGWVAWANEHHRKTIAPARGDLFYWLDGAHGHIGFFVKWETDNTHFVSLEGNTGDSGGRDGDGSYRKRRNAETLDHAHAKFGFISLKGL